jgi:transcriptional regulator with XRE-family HTH domain
MQNNEVFYKEVGNRIRKARQDRKITQQELADLVSLSRTSITNIEKGRQKLLLHTLIQISEALSVEPAKLMPKKEAKLEIDLEEALRNHPPLEREWIKSAVIAVRKEKTNDSS